MFFALWVPVIFVWGAGVTGLWVVYLQCPGQISSKYGQNTGGSTFEHRTSAENPWKANWNIRNTMGIWQVKPWKVTLQTCTRFKLQECQHGLQCWSREGAIILEMGRDINTLLNGRFANHLFHLHESHILFFIHPIYVQWCPCCIAHSVVLQEIHLSIHFNFHFQKICIYPCWMNFGWFFTTKKSQLHWSLLHGIQSHDCHHTRVGWRYYRNPTFGCKSCGFPGFSCRCE